MKIEKYEKERKIGKAITLIYASLESHLITPYYTPRKARFNAFMPEKEEVKFHQECVRDYAEVIKILSELY